MPGWSTASAHRCLRPRKHWLVASILLYLSLLFLPPLDLACSPATRRRTATCLEWQAWPLRTCSSLPSHAQGPRDYGLRLGAGGLFPSPAQDPRRLRLPRALSSGSCWGMWLGADWVCSPWGSCLPPIRSWAFPLLAAWKADSGQLWEGFGQIQVRAGILLTMRHLCESCVATIMLHNNHPQTRRCACIYGS